MNNGYWVLQFGNQLVKVLTEADQEVRLLLFFLLFFLFCFNLLHIYIHIYTYIYMYMYIYIYIYVTRGTGSVGRGAQGQ